MLVVAVESCLVHMIESNRVFSFLKRKKLKKIRPSVFHKKTGRAVTVVKPRNNVSDEEGRAPIPTIRKELAESGSALQLVGNVRDSFAERISDFNPIDLIFLVVCPVIFAYLSSDVY